VFFASLRTIKKKTLLHQRVPEREEKVLQEGRLLNKEIKYPTETGFLHSNLNLKKKNYYTRGQPLNLGILVCWHTNTNHSLAFYTETPQ